ncbi:MAG: TIGR04255 family protein [Desulfovibrio sp.]|jgi:uncharacterized protein (TIGR04255 family)|nr:TIGR04255 family protein [Desulfovibrio sp.]
MMLDTPPDHIPDPVIAPTPERIQLKRTAPYCVICQLRYTKDLTADDEDRVKDFQKEVQTVYPVLREERIPNPPSGYTPIEYRQLFAVSRFYDPRDEWRITLAPSFLAVETFKYAGRDDFFSRLNWLAHAHARHFSCGKVTNLGVRYINRYFDVLYKIHDFFRHEICGINGTHAADRSMYSLTETVFYLIGAQLLARWGMLPRNASSDPNSIKPMDVMSWLIDFDMFSTIELQDDIEWLITEARRYADEIYRFFRWSVTDKFIEHFRGGSEDWE